MVAFEFREKFTHLGFEHRNKFVHQRLAHIQERIGIANCTAQYTTYHVTGFYIRRKLSVGNGKSYSTKVIGDNAHGYITFGIRAIRYSCNFCYFSEQRSKNIGIVIALCALKHHAKTLESHTRIHMLCRQRNQRTVSLPVVLDKYVVPDFNNLRMVVVNEFIAGDFSFFSFITNVDMNFGARAAWAGVAHFPEIILFGTSQNAIFRNIFFPNFESFGIFGHIISSIATENGYI